MTEAGAVKRGMMVTFTRGILRPIVASLDCSPFGATTGRKHQRRRIAAPLYTPEERHRRDLTPWTVVQGVLAPLQFAIFLVSLALIMRYLFTGEGWLAANISIWVKTSALILIMITGSFWEKVVFGKYLFAPSFYWEDMFSMVVIVLHLTYISISMGGFGNADLQVYVALAAYAAYVINAVQFIMKLRAARRCPQQPLVRGQMA